MTSEQNCVSKLLFTPISLMQRVTLFAYSQGYSTRKTEGFVGYYLPLYWTKRVGITSRIYRLTMTELILVARGRVIIIFQPKHT